MIDLVSTRAGVEPQTAACCRLIAAIISAALQDLCIKPDKTEAKACANINPHARQSVEFFFGTGDKSPIVDYYAAMIGLSGQAIREAIMSDRPLKEVSAPRIVGFGATDRLRAQARVRWACKW